MGILDYFTPEARRGNRQALEGLLMQFIPPEMRPQLNLLAELNPVVSMERAGQDAQQLFAPDQTLMDRLAAGGRMASNMAGVVAPAMVAGRAGVPVANAVQDVLTGYAPMVQPFMADEFGGFRLYQGSPHNFAAERLVRMPDGSTQYVVGAPDRLPDVPAGAKLLQDFPLGRQRMDKIGTGEGAQAYGHGLYFAENEGIAKGYRDALSDPDAVPLRFKDKPVNTPWNADIRERWADEFAGLSEDDADAMEELLGNLSQVNNLADVKNVLDGVSPRAKSLYYTRVKKDLVKPDIGPGSMYEVQINADPEAFLDWDKPLSEQPQAVRDAMRPVFDGRYGAGFFDQYAADRNGLRDLHSNFDDLSAADVSKSLNEGGIPGIKYLDAGSRSAGDGSRNYVIFDENLINIVRKYGIAGAAAMLGMSQADVAQAMGQQPQGLLESNPQ